MEFYSNRIEKFINKGNVSNTLVGPVSQQLRQAQVVSVMGLICWLCGSILSSSIVRQRAYEINDIAKVFLCLLGC